MTLNSLALAFSAAFSLATYAVCRAAELDAGTTLGSTVAAALTALALAGWLASRVEQAQER